MVAERGQICSRDTEQLPDRTLLYIGEISLKAGYLFILLWVAEFVVVELLERTFGGLSMVGFLLVFLLILLYAGRFEWALRQDAPQTDYQEWIESRPDSVVYTLVLAIVGVVSGLTMFFIGWSGFWYNAHFVGLLFAFIGSMVLFTAKWHADRF